MKKNHLLSFIILLSFSLNIMAEEEPILFEVTTETYVLLENPISLNNGEIWVPGTTYELEFDFEFEINGQYFDQVLVKAGTGLTFPGYDYPSLWIWGSEWGGEPFLMDRGSDVSVSPIDYEVTGNPGEQILKIQWQNAGIRDKEGDDPNDFVNFQIWICEGTNRTEIHYGASQISDLSFGYNDGPGFRYYNLEDDWGYCLSGYKNLPVAIWKEFVGPIGGCLLDGVPDEGKVFNFYPNTSVSVKEHSKSSNLYFSFIGPTSNEEIQIKLSNFDPSKMYRLTVYNILGVKMIDQPIKSQISTVKISNIKPGIYFYILTDGNSSFQRKILSN